MSIKLGINIPALAAQRQLGKADQALASVYEQLSSGLRINRAKDDPAGLAVATSLNAESRVLTQATRNINDGISLLNTADSALEALSNITSRISELAVQSANGVFTTTQRTALDREAQALVSEFNRIIASTRFNGRDVFTTTGAQINIQSGAGTQNTMALTIGDSLTRRVGDGTFGTPVTYTAGTNTPGSVYADFNGDGIDDLVAGLSTPRITLGTGAGGFATATILFPGVNFVTQMMSGNFASTSSTDLLVAYTTGNAQIFIGNGNGTFALGTTATGANLGSQSTLNAADLNGDGYTDIVRVNSGQVTSLINNGSGSFTATQTFSNAYIGLATDLNADGIVDLVGDTAVYFGNGNGTFSVAQTYAAMSSTYYDEPFQYADFTGDGINDVLLVSSTGASLVTMVGSGDGTFSQFITQSNIVSTTTTTGLASADVNGDGYRDLALTFNGAAYDGQIWLGNGNGSFSPGVTFVDAGTPTAAYLDDVNGDGVSDLITSASAYVYLGNSVTTNTFGTVSLLSQGSSRVALEYARTVQERISTERADIGASMSRFESQMRSTQSQIMNLKEAYSRIMDVDVAEQSALLVKNQILRQAATAVLAQANSQPSVVLKLLS